MAVRNAIVPKLPLVHVIEHWERISEGLAESPRKRQLQLDYMSATNDIP